MPRCRRRYAHVSPASPAPTTTTRSRTEAFAAFGLPASGSRVRSGPAHAASAPAAPAAAAPTKWRRVMALWSLGTAESAATGSLGEAPVRSAWATVWQAATTRVSRRLRGTAGGDDGWTGVGDDTLCVPRAPHQCEPVFSFSSAGPIMEHVVAQPGC